MSEEKTLGQIDLLNGPIMKSIIIFAVPIVVSMLFQQLYNAVDTAIVGNVLGENALAAIGSVASVFELIVYFATGSCGGFGIVIARAYGSKDENLIKRAVAGSLKLGFVMVFAFTLLGMIGMPYLLHAINTPDEIYADALLYIRIVTAFLFVTFAYNFFSGILRSIGNSVMPLIFLIISSVLNVILDYSFIAILKMGVDGAAIATVISQAFSAILCLIYLLKKVKILIPGPEHFKTEPELIKDLAGQGIAMMFMSSIVSISSVILQSGINGIGTQIIAAHVAARKIMGLAALPFISVPVAVSVFVSQNKGADNKDRILKAMKECYIFFFIGAAVMALILWTTAPFLIRLISGSDNPVVIQNGAKYLYVLGPFLCVLGIINFNRNSLQGIGYKIVAVISSVIELCGKVMFVILLIPSFGYNAVIWCEPSIWIFMAMELIWAWNSNDYIKGDSSNEKNNKQVKI
ncbi:MATE family efflux transporter [Butyrivibrio sp. AE3006]|uniref:MATE family efflux transporter n=1 Tax=Butyrivibrio sp. AE3006 TaxID=1280673 RepID=UPI0003FC4FE6|nr:MATE family efflux transporter [Butyrivibrio sp. AE3006]